ncbi:MAG: hypothetical protein VYD90_06185 [Pseudomonadota bacterium]|uniref:hypothetical protein n=1 Tax=Novosphingobium sp. MBES04 TaxID=1206458 RepID=UPI0005804E58|nr:hypothetical protein [Novosphingobium sp. MBES04]MED5544822.1 hypothetical protein [Pseudomonadota bacterium]GAM03228.1 hypothetical conserved protein [Novosphingobium sp. MBES04]
MNLTQDRVRSIGWITVLAICAAMLVALTLRVNAVKSEVYAAEKRIVYTQQQINFLETEFQTRANQQALKKLNDLEFGYAAPGAGQYLEGERQLAALGAAPGPDAPAPIRYANAEPADIPGEDVAERAEEKAGSLLAMVNPVSGATAAAMPEEERRREVAAAKTRDADREALRAEAADLSRRLASINIAEAPNQ